MKAREISQVAYQVEKQIAKEIAPIVNKRLKELTDKTGLQIGDIWLRIHEVTTVSSIEKEYVVAGVEIGRSLPDAYSEG